MAIYSEIKKCRGCGSGALEEIWSAGSIYIPAFPDARNIGEPAKAPLTLVVCCDCWLVQLKHSVEPDKLYRNFWYRSGTNEMMKAALRDVVDSAVSRVDLKEGDAVVDIGCNDGTLFQFYGTKNLWKFGFDPARNIQSPGIQSSNGGWEFVCDYFCSDLYVQKMVRKVPAKIVTACAMFYDLEDPVEFVKDVKRILHLDGVFVIQMNYLPLMMTNCCIDNVSHEHLCYYSLRSLEELLTKAGMFLFDAETNDVNGGSVRAYVSTRPRQVTDNLFELLEIERDLGLGSLKPYAEFVKQVESRLRFLDLLLADLGKKKEVIYIYGASTRGLTLMQLLENTREIRGAAERDAMKWGKVMVGSWTPIISEQEARKRATVFFVLPYHFLPGIIQREKVWIQGGGKLLVPLPEPRVLGASDVHREWMVEEERRA